MSFGYRAFGVINKVVILNGVKVASRGMVRCLKVSKIKALGHQARNSISFRYVRKSKVRKTL